MLTGRKTEMMKVTLWSVVTFVTLVFILFPIYMLIKYSISDPSTLNTMGAPVPLWPNHPTLSILQYLFKSREFWQVVRNSLGIAFSTVLLTMTLGVPAGFALARNNIPFKKVFLILLISVRLFPDVSSVVPVTTFFIKLGLHDTFFGLVLVHTLLSLPYMIFISSSAFEFISRDIEDQARVIGAGPIRIFTQILVPIVYPSLVAGAIYTFLLSWDEFIFANYLLMNTATLPTYLNYNIGVGGIQPNVLAAISVCLSLPVIIFTFTVQRYMVSGISAGAVK